MFFYLGKLKTTKKGNKKMNKEEKLKIATQFLKAIYHDPKNFAIAGEAGLGTKYETRFFNPGDYEAMAEHAINIKDDAFFHLCTHDSAQAEASARQRKGDAFNGKFRGQIKTAQTMGGLWLDLDLHEADKDNGKNYPDSETALEVLRKLPMWPSMIISSGSGYHVYWLSKEPIPASDNLDLPRKWTEYLREAFEGYDLDSVHDCARILRVPGSYNKGKLVEIVYMDDTVRYSLDNFNEKVSHIPEKQFIAYSGGHSNVVIDLKKKPSNEKMKELTKDSNFANVFFKTFDYKKDNSHSSTDWSLARIALKLGWSEQEIIDLMIYCRQCNNEPTHEHNVNKFLRTIERARSFESKSI